MLNWAAQLVDKGKKKKRVKENGKKRERERRRRRRRRRRENKPCGWCWRASRVFSSSTSHHQDGVSAGLPASSIDHLTNLQPITRFVMRLLSLHSDPVEKKPNKKQISAVLAVVFSLTPQRIANRLSALNGALCNVLISHLSHLVCVHCIEIPCLVFSFTIQPPR